MRVTRSEDNIVDMSFVNTPDGLPLLLVTYDHRVDVIGQRRLDYYQENSMWAVVTSTRLNRSGISALFYEYV